MSSTGDGGDRRFRRTLRDQVGAKRSGLKRREPRRRAFEHHIGRRLALKHLAHKNQLAVFVAVADAIADHALAERRGQLRREIAHLIGVRQQDQIGLGLRDGLLQRVRVSVRRVGGEQIVLDEQNFVELGGGEFIGQRGHAFADDDGQRGGSSFPRQFAAPRPASRSWSCSTALRAVR